MSVNLLQIQESYQDNMINWGSSKEFGFSVSVKHDMASVSMAN